MKTSSVGAFQANQNAPHRMQYYDMKMMRSWFCFVFLFIKVGDQIF